MKPIIGRLARWIGFALLAIAILLIGAWCSVAIWYRCTAGEPVCGLLAGATLVFALVAVACLATPRRWLALAVYAGFFATVFSMPMYGGKVADVNGIPPITTVQIAGRAVGLDVNVTVVCVQVTVLALAGLAML